MAEVRLLFDQGVASGAHNDVDVAAPHELGQHRGLVRACPDDHLFTQ